MMKVDRLKLVWCGFVVSSLTLVACSDFEDKRILTSGKQSIIPKGDEKTTSLDDGALAEQCVAEGICEKSDAETLARSVRDYVNRSCVSCHGPDKAEGGVRLDSWEAIDKYAKRIVAIGLKREEHPGVAEPSETDKELLTVWEAANYIIPASVVFNAKSEQPVPVNQDPVKTPVTDPVKDPGEPINEDPSQNEPAVEDPSQDPVVEDPVKDPVKDPVVEEPVVDPVPPAVHVDEPKKKSCICRFLKFFRRTSKICS